MPKLKPDTQAARRENILDAAERCFARAGFHRTTMQDICKEAGVSLGAIYVYFKSKEDLIAGMCERDRAELSRDMSELADAPDLMGALQKLGEHYTVERSRHKQLLHVEIGIESTRNDGVCEMYRSVDRFVRDGFASVFERARAEGRIAPDVDSETLAEMLSVIGDGMFWRQAVDPEFDSKKILPLVGSTNRLMHLRRVDFPDPLLPRITTNSPAFTLKETSLRAWVPFA